MKHHKHWLAGITALLLGGCATFSDDGGTRNVNEALNSRGITQQAPWIKNDADAVRAGDQVRTLLAQPLTAESAVQIALLNNRGLQAGYAELGIAEADLVQAGRMRNPGFSFSRKHRGEVVEYERAFIFDLLGLLTMPLRTQIEGERFQLAQHRITAEILQVAADTRRAWAGAVAAQQTAAYAEQVRSAAEAAAELARRMALAGNFSKLDQAREQAFYAEATAQLARSRQAALAAREQLTRLLGLWGKDLAYRLVERLPELPPALPAMTEIEQQAMQQRLDLQEAMQDAANLANTLGLTKTTGWFSVLEVSYLRNSESGEPRQTGYEIELRLPIFDFGTAKVARAEYTYMQAVNRAADLAVRARSEVRVAYGAWRTAYDLAKHYREEVVPLRARISEETLLRYNGMLMSVFELLAESRQQVNAVISAIDAQRDFWIADATLQLAINGRSPGAIAAPGGTIRAAAPAAGGH
ncbi:MAG: TolC family protein [Betaproteobacteria bacterium]|nr:MAG: TolC family protein [Betaproteobacteria bacterium]